jgi:transposase
MASRRRFSNLFKRTVVEECLSGAYTQAQLSRRYNISPNVIQRWRKENAEDKLIRDNDADILARDARIRELERMVGKLTMEIEFLKKAEAYIEQRRKENSSIVTGPKVVQYKRGVQ